MKKIRLLLPVYLVFTLYAQAQSASEADALVTREKNILLQTVASLAPDNQVSLPVIRNLEVRIFETVSDIDRNQKLNLLSKDKAKKSLVYFLQESNKYLARKRLHIYDMGTAISAYQVMLKTILQHQPVIPVLRPMSTRNTELLAAAFTQYRERDLLDDAATFKRMSETPEYILPYLESKPGFRFADSLLFVAAVHDPLNLIYYLRKQNSVLQARIRNVPDNYIRQVVSIAEDKNATELAIFAPQVAKGKISSEEILRTRMEPTKYFQLLVNSLLETKTSLATNLMRNGIREKASAFYVKEINELHNSPESVRFASVNALRPQDLYFIITNCGDELYTSSYLGLYKRLIASYGAAPVDSLFELVQWENFDVFIRMAANYNVLDDFLKHLSPSKLPEVLQLFIGYLESDPETALDKAMDIADSFGALENAPGALDLFQTEIRSNLERCQAKQNLKGIRLYTILDQMLTLTREKDGRKKIWQVLGDYERLKQNALQDEENNITEVVLFYGDEDGVSSFSNFLRTYADRSKWNIEKNEQWIRIRSVGNDKLSIYANLPLSMENKSDLAAQEGLFDHLRSNLLQPSILVHRGHSYHLDKTIKRLSPSVKLAILGSCGGYNKSISLAIINPDIQVIGSKKTGSKSINDPILDQINDNLINGQDLDWNLIWEKLTNRFRKDPSTLSLFNEYFTPRENMGLFLLKLYQGNRRLL